MEHNYDFVIFTVSIPKMRPFKFGHNSALGENNNRIVTTVESIVHLWYTSNSQELPGNARIGRAPVQILVPP